MRKRKFGENLKFLILKIENMIFFFKNNIIKLFLVFIKNFEEGFYFFFIEIVLIDFYLLGIVYFFLKLFR